MIASNEELPHIEQLARQEFILDTEEHMQMQADEDELILQVREQIELNNLASMFIRERIKAECWDEMAVKGLVVKVHYHVCMKDFLSSLVFSTGIQWPS